MALVTGKNCIITVGGKDFSHVTNNFEAAFDTQATEYQTLAGPIAGPGSETGSLDVTWAYDSGETDSLFDALWTAADAGTPVAYVLTVGKSKFTGNAVASRPNIPADAEAPSECSVSMTLNGIPVKSAVAAP
jgi:hypothetical protein